MGLGACQVKPISRILAVVIVCSRAVPVKLPIHGWQSRSAPCGCAVRHSGSPWKTRGEPRCRPGDGTYGGLGPLGIQDFCQSK